MDLDLNQEPLESPSGPIMELTPLLNELETVHGRIEERIRQLEAVTSRIRQRQMLREGQSQTIPQIDNISSEASVVNIDNISSEVPVVNIYDHPPEISVGSGKISKQDGTHLIAKALGMEKSSSKTGGYFDCNICLDRARDPIVTSCGHLFCWPCFFQLPCSYSNVKECPICEGEVTDTSVIPIYGNGNGCNSDKPKSKESGLDVPPRPRAKRIESVRQKLVTRGIPLLAMEEAIQQMRRLIDTIGQRTRSQGNDTGTTNTLTNGDQQNQSLGGSRLSYPSLVENPDGFVEGSNMRRDQELSRVVDGNSRSRVDVVVQGETSDLDTASEIISLAPNSTAPSRGFAVSNVVVEMRNQTVDNATEMGSTVPSTSSLSSRRRTEASYVDNDARNRSRRRRLR